MTMTRFERFSVCVTQFVGHFWTFLGAVLLIAVWLCLGPAFGWSDSWQLLVNTATTIVTFLMVFVIQQSQNRDALKLQLKIDELVAAQEGASNRVISVEDLSEGELRGLLARYERIPAGRQASSIEELERERDVR